MNRRPSVKKVERDGRVDGRCDLKWRALGRSERKEKTEGHREG